MSRRRILWAAYWTAVTLTAALASLAAAIPFTGGTASAAGIAAAGLVLIAGFALEPRKDVRP